MVVTLLDNFELVVERAAQRLIGVAHEAAGSFVTTPLTYPGGGAVVVWVDRAHPRYVVTDFGFGIREAELMGSERASFNKLASRVAEIAGVDFAQDGSFRVVVDESRIEGAIRTIAGCAQECATQVATRLAERTRADASSLLYAKLVRIFGQSSVAKDASYPGSSQTQWTIAGLVSHDGTTALFDPVTPYFASFAATLAKFSDIKLLENAPARTSVLSQHDGFGTWITALSQTSSVVEQSAEDGAFRRSVLH